MGRYSAETERNHFTDLGDGARRVNHLKKRPNCRICQLGENYGN